MAHPDKKPGVYASRIKETFDNFKRTGDLQVFAIRMAWIGDVRYDWQADTVRYWIRKLIPGEV